MTGISIVSTVVHDLEKSGSSFDVKVAGGLHPINAHVEHVIGALNDKYGKKVSKSYGSFAQTSLNATPSFIQAYMSSDPKDFLDLTSKMMDELKVQASVSTRHNATAGHVFFAHIIDNGSDILIVAIVNDKPGSALDHRMHMSPIDHLDLDNFRFAGRIDISSWISRKPRYVGFLKGRGEVSEYFRAFLGCEKSENARQDTTALIDAIKSFPLEVGMTPQEGSDLLKKANAILDDMAANGKSVDLAEFSAALYPIDAELIALHFAMNNLNDGFVPDKRSLTGLTTYRTETNQWSADFQRDAYINGQVIVEDDRIIFMNPPQEFIDKLRSEIPNV